MTIKPPTIGKQIEAPQVTEVLCVMCVVAQDSRAAMRIDGRCRKRRPTGTGVGAGWPGQLAGVSHASATEPVARRRSTSTQIK